MNEAQLLERLSSAYASIDAPAPTATLTALIDAGGVVDDDSRDTAAVVVPFARPRPRMRMRYLVAALVASFVAMSGLAAAGALPDPLQRGISSVVSHLGIDLPNPQPGHGGGDGPGPSNNGSGGNGGGGTGAGSTATSTTAPSNGRDDKHGSSTAGTTVPHGTATTLPGGVTVPGSTPTTLPGGLPPITVPPVSVPPISVPPISVPPITVPQLPPITLPVITLPPIQLPVITLPPITLPPLLGL